MFLFFIPIIQGMMVKILDGLSRCHRVGSVDTTRRIDTFRRSMKMVVVVFDPLTVFPNLDDCSELLDLLLLLSGSDGGVGVFVVAQVVNGSTAEGSVSIGSVPAPIVAGSWWNKFMVRMLSDTFFWVGVANNGP